jgi:alkanesulfonate monooxygenase SsuD/methylene tetrahydromethanopterin reductase-like flavin-dependent oxidoreductase (luciferase family)
MVDWIRKAFTEPGMFSHSGQFYDIPDMTFTTKPVQQPLPMWWGGMGPRNLARAAERGMNLIAPFNAGYDAALEACGRNPADYAVSVMVPVCVADTTDKAWEIAGPGIEYFVNFYQMRKNLQGEPAPADARVTQEMLRTGNAGFWFAAVGSPDEVTAKLRPFVDGKLGRITQLALQMRQPGMSTDDTHRSMRMFADEVIPALS